MKKSLRFLTLFLLSYLLASRSEVNAQTIQTGKSYVNVTKGATGGTIEAGDILEIRATIAVGAWDGTDISLVHYIDTIPTNTTYIPGSLKILSNEGLPWQNYSDAAADDQAYIDLTSGILRINMGSSYNNNTPANVNMGGICSSVMAWATPDGGRIMSNGRPSFYGGVAIMSASFRIQINTGLAYGTMISMFGGAYRFRVGGVDTERPFNPYLLSLNPNLGLCSNSIGGSAILEDGGTFGGGSIQNRAGTAFIIAGYSPGAVAFNFPNDGAYSIINNLSPSGSTDINSALPDNASTDPTIARVHRLWDIMGDHGGATQPATGNPPAAPGDSAGYFVAINASYANSNAIQQTVGGLCPNTYYEFSAWFKNICKYCACDTTANPPYMVSGAIRVPNPSFNGPDSSGVNPNLTFTIDGVDYYTTGTLQYTGQWVKKGFVYLTGPGQTSFTVTIRNNAAGGGGNDWAIDDVSVATCTPNLNLTPSGNVNVCYGDGVNMTSVVRSYYPNYVEWIWERSSDAGLTWNGTGQSGTATPTLVSGEQEYTVIYPPFIADSSVHKKIFRIRVATTTTNLASSACSFSNSANIIVWVNNCSFVLSSDIISFSGKSSGGHAILQWKSTIEASGVWYEIERSEDRINFRKAGAVAGKASEGFGSDYTFTDPDKLNGPVYYRIRIVDSKSSKFSKIVLLSNTAYELSLRSLKNPFSDRISFDLESPGNNTAVITLIDGYGRIIKQIKENIIPGINNINIDRLGRLSNGTYSLRVQVGEKVINKKVVKI